jgi:hypothetical protein
VTRLAKKSLSDGNGKVDSTRFVSVGSYPVRHSAAWALIALVVLRSDVLLPFGHDIQDEQLFDSLAVTTLTQRVFKEGS